jgi:hypothetical protein
MMRRLQECHRLGGGAYHVESFSFTMPAVRAAPRDRASMALTE